MDDRFNTAAGWVLFSGIVALGASIASNMYFHADSHEYPEGKDYGFFIEGGEEEGVEAGEMSVAEAMTMPGVDVAAGEKVFAKCSACHTVNQGGANGIGPNLYGVMGTPVGAHAAGFAYSDALKSKGGTWDWDTMSEWLKNPRAFANGTKMSFAGLSKVEDRAAVMLYMNSMGSNLPVPEFVAATAEAAEGAESPVEGEAADAVDAAGATGADTPVAENPGAPEA